jgi:hypothetical protein
MYSKNKLSELDLEYSEAHWKAAEKLIDAQKKQRNKLGWWWMNLLDVMLLFSMGTALALSAVNNYPVSKQPLVASTYATKENVQYQSTNEEQNQVIRNEQNTNTVLTQNANNTAEENSTIIASQTIPASQNKPSSSIFRGEIAVSANRINNENKRSSSEQGNFTSSSVTDLNKLSRENIAVDNKNNHSAEENNSISKIDKTDAEPVTPLTNDDNAENLTIAEETIVQQEEIDKPETTPSVSSLLKPAEYIVKTGFGLHPGNLNSSFYLGLEYQKLYSNNIGYYAAGFVMHRAIANESIIIDNKQYDFGSYTNPTSYQPRAIISSNVLVGLFYLPAERHQISLGVGISYLNNVYGKLTETLQSETTESLQWGYRQGIKKLDMMLNMGYAYRLTTRISFETSLLYGFSDLSDNNFWQNEQFNRNVFIKAGIRYRFAGIPLTTLKNRFE